MQSGYYLLDDEILKFENVATGSGSTKIIKNDQLLHDLKVNNKPVFSSIIVSSDEGYLQINTYLVKTVVSIPGGNTEITYSAILEDFEFAVSIQLRREDILVSMI